MRKGGGSIEPNIILTGLKLSVWVGVLARPPLSHFRIVVRRPPLFLLRFVSVFGRRANLIDFYYRPTPSLFRPHPRPDSRTRTLFKPKPFLETLKSALSTHAIFRKKKFPYQLSARPSYQQSHFFVRKHVLRLRPWINEDPE